MRVPRSWGSSSNEEQPREWQLHYSENPWQPHASYDPSSQVYRRMMGILNRVTEQTFDLLLEQALKLPLNESENLSAIIDLGILKAQDEPLFVQVYARLFSELAIRLNIKESLATASREHFIEKYNIVRNSNVSIEASTLDDIYNDILLRKRLIMHMWFVCELHNFGVVPLSQIVAMNEALLGHGDFRSFECLCRLLNFAGAKLDQTHTEMVTRSFNHIVSNIEVMPTRLKFLAEDTLALRLNGWQRSGRSDGVPNW